MIERGEIIESYIIKNRGDWEEVMDAWYSYLEKLGVYGTKDDPREAGIFDADFSDRCEAPAGVDLEFCAHVSRIEDIDKHLRKVFGKKNVIETTMDEV